MWFVGTRNRFAGFVLAVLSLAAVTLAQADSAERLAEELVKLRGAVEESNAELDRKKSDHRMDMRALHSQRAEMQAELQRERLKNDKLKASLAKQRELARKVGGDQKELKPVVFQALDDLEAQIRRSLPFKTPERLSEVDALRRQVQTDVLTPHKAINRLWGLYEDEIRLVSENALDRQVIQLDGEERLADVARLGMVMMYFRTTGGDFGRVDNSGGGWQYGVLQRGEDRDRVATLFDALNRQIRTGYFELPAAFPGAISGSSEKP
jgi:hypothetical protein